MKKSSISIIIGFAIATVLGITAVGMLYDELFPDIVDTPTLSGRLHPDGISSGPLTITKPTFKIRENIFFIVDGLKEDEKGSIRFFVPDVGCIEQQRMMVQRNLDLVCILDQIHLFSLDSVKEKNLLERG